MGCCMSTKCYEVTTLSIGDELVLVRHALAEYNEVATLSIGDEPMCSTYMHTRRLSHQ